MSWYMKILHTAWLTGNVMSWFRISPDFKLTFCKNFSSQSFFFVLCGLVEQRGIGRRELACCDLHVWRAFFHPGVAPCSIDKGGWASECQRFVWWYWRVLIGFLGPSYSGQTNNSSQHGESARHVSWSGSGILITASLSSKMNRTHVCWKCVHSGDQNLDPWFIASHRCSLTLVVSSWNVASSCPVLVLQKTSITMSHKPIARIPYRRRTIVQRNDFCFSATVRYSSLFLTRPPSWNQRGFRNCSELLLPLILNPSSLETVQVCIACHVTILSVSTRAMNVWYQPGQSLTTSSAPLRATSCS